MTSTPKTPTVAKYTEYAFDVAAKLIGQEDFYKRLDLAAAAVCVAVRFPVRDNASVAKLLRDIAGQLELQEG
ncbi:MAG TPA: hypothetical protein DCM68_07860 [Verrucomicrobia bacterium]|nr:hypothetical protein [Verrucomicrobiota bacterium]